jgi:hypothetical protein
MSLFEELAERCEQATGPDRELDAAILAAVNDGHGHVTFETPRYTASLDAAMTLVPEGAQVLLSSINPEKEAVDGRWHSIAGDPEATEDTSSGVTPALALCAAALRARAASCDGRPKGGDSTEIEAPFTTSAVPKGDAQNTLSNGIEP